MRSRFIACRPPTRAIRSPSAPRRSPRSASGWAREQFRLGSRTFTELQQDIDAACQAERGVITQLFDFLEPR